MQKFETLRQPLLGELAMSRKREREEEEREKNTAKRNIKPLIFGTANMTSPYY